MLPAAGLALVQLVAPVALLAIPHLEKNAVPLAGPLRLLLMLSAWPSNPVAHFGPSRLLLLPNPQPGVAVDFLVPQVAVETL